MRFRDGVKILASTHVCEVTVAPKNVNKIVKKLFKILFKFF